MTFTPPKKLKSRRKGLMIKKSDEIKISSPQQNNIMLIEEINSLITSFSKNFFLKRAVLYTTNEQNLKFIKDHLIRCQEILDRS